VLPEVPVACRCPAGLCGGGRRRGIATYHHPQLLQAFNEHPVVLYCGLPRKGSDTKAFRMRPGRFARPRRFDDAPAKRALTLREWEDLLDWSENRRRRTSRGLLVCLASLCAMVIGRTTKRWLRDRRRGWSGVLAAAENRKRQGAPRGGRVHVTTPDEPDSAKGSDADTPPVRAPAGAPPRRRSVLVVDDDMSARATVATILKRASFKVSEAGSVAEALRGLHGRPDWVLLDLLLPDGSGCGVLRSNAYLEAASRVCVISGAGPAMLHEAQSLGVRHVFTKPPDVPRLMSLLQS